MALLWRLPRTSDLFYMYHVSLDTQYGAKLWRGASWIDQKDLKESEVRGSLCRRTPDDCIAYVPRVQPTDTVHLFVRLCVVGYVYLYEFIRWYVPSYVLVCYMLFTSVPVRTCRFTNFWCVNILIYDGRWSSSSTFPEFLVGRNMDSGGYTMYEATELLLNVEICRLEPEHRTLLSARRQ